MCFALGSRTAIIQPWMWPWFDPLASTHCGLLSCVHLGQSLLSTIALLLSPTLCPHLCSLLPPLCQNPGAAHECSMIDGMLKLEVGVVGYKMPVYLVRLAFGGEFEFVNGQKYQ